MKQVWIPRYGGPEVLEVRDAPDPTPAAGELRIRVEAAGVNFADAVARMGAYQDAPPGPIVVGYEVAGTVDAVGEGVSAARIGEPVVAMTRFGGYSTAVCVPEAQAMRRPDGLDAVHGAAIPVVYLTAWMALEQFGRVRAGDRVLVHSAGGGVGLAALDLIKWRGAYAIGTASAKKHAFLRERGYDELIDYTTTDFEAALKGAERLDLILDAVGGDSWAKGLRLLRPGGRLVCYGVSGMTVGERRSVWSALKWLTSAPWLQMTPIALMNTNKGVCGINMGRMWDDGARVVGWLADVLRLWSEGHVRPIVHAAVPFSRAAEAHAMLHGRENVGKIVLVPDAIE